MTDLTARIRKGESGLWATHDDVLACILGNMQLWDGQWPGYATFVAFETFGDGSIRVLRDGVELKRGIDLADLIHAGIDYQSECATAKPVTLRDIRARDPRQG